MNSPSEPGTGDSVRSGSTSGADVVLHAERLSVSSDRFAVERVRFSKRVVTTTRTVEIPVRIEQLVVHHEPFPERTPVDARVAPDPADLVIVLHEEVPEVTLRVQPVERVTVQVRSVTGEETVTAELRSEIADVDRR